jgi:hypothetical protein
MFEPRCTQRHKRRVSACVPFLRCACSRVGVVHPASVRRASAWEQKPRWFGVASLAIAVEALRGAKDLSQRTRAAHAAAWFETSGTIREELSRMQPVASAPASRGKKQSSRGKIYSGAGAGRLIGRRAGLALAPVGQPSGGPGAVLFATEHLPHFVPDSL